MDALRVAGPERLTVQDGRWLGLLRTLVTGRFEPIVLPSSFEPVANLVAGSSVRFEGDRFLIPGASTEDMRFGAVFSLKAYPASTAPGIFDQFDLEFDSVVTQSFTPIEQIEALACGSACALTPLKRPSVGLAHVWMPPDAQSS